MLIRWTIYPILMAVLAVIVIVSGNDPVLAWILVGLFALSLAFRVYLSRIIGRSR